MVSSSWTLETLGSIANGQYGLVDGPFGSNLPASEYTEKGIPVIRGSNLSLGDSRFRSEQFVFVSKHTAARLGRSLCKPDDIIFTKKGTIGQTGIIPGNLGYENFLLSSNQMKLTVDPTKARPLFVYYFVSSASIRKKIIQDASVTGVPKINLAYIRTLPILLPPLDEQDQVIGMLGAIDEQIEQLIKKSSTLEAITRATFKSWFVDFDPVRAKAERREPEGMDPATAALFPDKFEESRLGNIPMGWSTKRVGEIADRIAMGPFGSSIKVETFVQSGVPIVSGNHLRTFMLDDTDYNFINEEHALRLSKALVSSGDVIFTHAGNIGNVSIVPQHSRYSRYIMSQRQFYLRCDRSKINANYVALYFTSREGKQKLLANSSSVGVPSIARPVTYLSSIVILVPEMRILNAFDGIVGPIFEAIQRNRHQINTLNSIRDTLLPRLVSGKLRMPDAEKLLEPVL
jgi:type I restriction enzyme S subunit